MPRGGGGPLGAARAEAHPEPERHIVERRERGLFGDLRFTLTNTARSCHPERLVRGARSVVADAVPVKTAPPARPRGATGRLPRYAWRDPYATLRERLARVAEDLRGQGARAAVFV